MLDRIKRNIAKHIELTDAEFDYFASLLQPRHVTRRTSILTPGQICWFEGFVDAGCLRVYCTDEDGGDQILYFVPEDWWFADIQSFVSQTPAVFGIDALEDSDILLIDKRSKESLYLEVPKFERLFRIMTQRALVALQHRMIAYMHQTAEERYLEFKQKYPNLEDRVCQHQVAAYLGISPEFLSKIRRKLTLGVLSV
ncbi:MAG: Crp/Fnr family transcriptional regulator [Acidimicrobiia bacterium]